MDGEHSGKVILSPKEMGLEFQSKFDSLGQKTSERTGYDWQDIDGKATRLHEYEEAWNHRFDENGRLYGVLKEKYAGNLWSMEDLYVAVEKSDSEERQKLLTTTGSEKLEENWEQITKGFIADMIVTQASMRRRE